MSERSYYVYEAYDADGICLYVGFTGNLKARLSSHLRPSFDARGWFGPFHDSWRISGPYTEAVALRIEAERIHQYQPIFSGQIPRQRERPAPGRGVPQVPRRPVRASPALRQQHHRRASPFRGRRNLRSVS